MGRLIVLGAGTFAVEVTDLIEDEGQHEVMAYAISEGNCHEFLKNSTILMEGEISKSMARTYRAIGAIISVKRSGFIERCEERGFRFVSVVHPSASVSRCASLGPGTIVSRNVAISVGATLEGHIIVNRGALLGHHVSVGRFSTIGPGANIAGDVSIGRGVMVGIGAIILEGRRVGDGAVVGAGAVVTKNVAPGAQVLGIPAR